MNKIRVWLTGAAMVWVVAALGAPSAPPDSIGYFLKDGDTIILYEVNSGETLFSIGRKYSLPIEVLRHFNPTLENDQIREGQILKVPGRSALAKMMNPEVKPRQQKPSTTKATMKSHTVAHGETLYGISRQYDVRVSEILKVNPNLDPNRIHEGQILQIPVNQDAQSQTEPAVEPNGPAASEERKPEMETKPGEYIANDRPTIDTDKYKTHTVRKGETMYALSRAYDAKVTEIMEWNNLQTFEIDEGQVLIVGLKETGSKAFQEPVSEQPVTEVAERKPVITPEPESPSYTTPTPEREGRENVLSLQYKEDLSSTYYTEKEENGIATWIRDVEGYPLQQGYFALHKSLPIGTIIKVRNLMNSRVVYAKVIGKLPDNGMENKIALKLPESAKKELQVLDEQLIMEVSYLSRK